MNLTPDEPYRPSFPDAKDSAELLALTRPGRAERLSERAVAPREGARERAPRSLLPPSTPALRSVVRAAGARLKRGEDLRDEDIRRIVQLSLLRLVESRRPTVARAACEALRDMLTAPGMESGAQPAQRDAEEEPELHLPD